MSIPILDDEQFRRLKQQGMARQVTVDGVKVWQIEVPKNMHIDAPSNMDFTKEALRVVIDYLQDADQFALVAFAEDALLMMSNTSGTERPKLADAIARLDRIDLGDETYMARGIEACYKQMLPGRSPERVDRMILLTDGYTKDERDCYTWVRKANQDKVVISTMGLGMDFNQELMIALADTTGGHAYFIQEPKEIMGAFRQELSTAQSITWRDLTLALDMPGEITLRRAHKITPAIAKLPEKEPALALGDLASGQPPAVLLELVVPARPVGNYRLAQITLSGRAAGRSDRQTMATENIVIRYSEKPSLTKQTDAHLMDIVQRVSVYKLHQQAVQDIDRGNVAGATRKLRAAGERLIEMGQDDLGHTMLVEAELMEKEEAEGAPAGMSSEGTKKLRYGTRKLA